MARAVAVLVLYEVRCDGVKPSRESLAGIKLSAFLVNPDEGLLRGVGGIIFVLQATNEIIQYFPGVAFHEVVQSSLVPGREPRHIDPVALVERRVLLGGLPHVVCPGAHGLTFTEKLTLPLPRGPS